MPVSQIPSHNINVSISTYSLSLFLPQLIDFGAFLNGNPSTRSTIAKQISDAFISSGFLYLQNHPIEPSTIKTAFSHSARFFSRPQSQKDALAWLTPESNRGYVASGREKVTQSEEPEEIAKLRASNPDLKESMEIGRENVPGLPNRWPTDLSTKDNDPDAQEFTTFMKSFFLQLKQVHIEVMRAIALGMGLDEDFFDPFTDGGDNNLRLLHYPAVRKEVFKRNPGQVRAGEHSDYGSITLLFQDLVGGLEVRSPQGTWVRATPIEGTIVVNAGDLLSRWANDRIRSTKHRVIQPPPKPEEMEDADDPEAMFPARYSIAYFCNPNFDRLIEALPGTWEGVEGGKKYEGIQSGEYLVRRLAATY
jgi:isopenicillin N synthase-like dioxygenase